MIATLLDLIETALGEGQKPEDIVTLVQNHAEAHLQKIAEQRGQADRLDVERHALGSEVKHSIDPETGQLDRRALETRLVHRLYANRFAERDRYTIAAAAWIFDRPHLRIVQNRTMTPPFKL